MAWSYPEISLEDLMKLIKAFIDMLLLASGYQSTGRQANWRSDDIKRAFQWALFLQNVSKDLSSSDDYRECVEELDAALSELASMPNFPQGLVPLPCAALCRAKDLMLEGLVNSFPMRESHLKALMMASVEMDIDSLQAVESNSTGAYLEKLMMATSMGLYLRAHKGQEVPRLGRNREELICVDFSVPLIHELGGRQLAVSLLSSAQSGMGILSETLGKSICRKFGNSLTEERMKHSSSVIAEELPVDSSAWSQWKLRSLSYMTDKRTMRLVSGANLIFSAPKGQWEQMFQRIAISAGDDEMSELTELLLSGCIAHRWTALIEHLMSVSYESITISRLYDEVFKLLMGKSRNLLSSQGSKDIKGRNGISFLEISVKSHLSQVWKLSPVLAAVAIPRWSELFSTYLHELQVRLRGDSSATRCCSCKTDGLMHRECTHVLSSYANYSSSIPLDLSCFGTVPVLPRTLHTLLGCLSVYLGTLFLWMVGLILVQCFRLAT